MSLISIDDSDFLTINPKQLEAVAIRVIYALAPLIFKDGATTVVIHFFPHAGRLMIGFTLYNEQAYLYDQFDSLTIRLLALLYRASLTKKDFVRNEISFEVNAPSFHERAEAQSKMQAFLQKLGQAGTPWKERLIRQIERAWETGRDEGTYGLGRFLNESHWPGAD